MMKKVLALVMVFSMVGFAGAALQIVVDDAAGTASVVGQIDADQYLIWTAGAGASLNNIALGTAAPSMSGPFMSAADFEALGVGYVAPAGFVGEAYVFASAPGEAYKQGAYMNADFTIMKGQDVTGWEEIIYGCDPKNPQSYLIRTWTEVTNWVKGGIDLAAFSEITGATTLIQRVDLNTSTTQRSFVDGECIPEPMTLSLLGLGALVLRRRS